MILNERLHILFDNGSNFILLKRIIDYVENIIIKNKNIVFNKIDEDGSKYINIENKIPKYLNSFEWLNNDFEIRIHKSGDIYASFWQDNCEIKNNKLSYAIFNLYINYNDFDASEYFEFLHHEFLHAYEFYNKLNNIGYGLKYYPHYNDLFEDYESKTLNTLMEYVYICIPEESRAFLQNFYQQFLKNKKFKKSNVYNFIHNYKSFLNELDNLTKIEHVFLLKKCAPIISEVFNIKVNDNFLEEIKKHITLRCEKLIIKMDKIGTGIITGYLTEDEKTDYLFHLKKNRNLERNNKFKNIKI